MNIIKIVFDVISFALNTALIICWASFIFTVGYGKLETL